MDEAASALDYDTEVSLPKSENRSPVVPFLRDSSTIYSAKR